MAKDDQSTPPPPPATPPPPPATPTLTPPVAPPVPKRGEYPQQNKPEIELAEAAMRGDVEEVTKLLQASTNPNTQDQEGSTPLHSAVSWSQTITIKTLLAGGADPNIRDKENVPPLFTAAVFAFLIDESVEIIDALLEAGADHTARDPADDATAYHWAMRAGNKKVAEYLKSKGVPGTDTVY